MVCDSILEDIVKKYIDRNAMVSNVTETPFLVGENFNSELMRIKISYSTSTRMEEQKCSMIAKYLPDDCYMLKTSVDMKLFDREMLLYQSTLPQLYSFGCLKCIAPQPYFILTEPKPAILLEDLSLLDFRTLSRDTAFDMNHCLYILDRLAAFHASSVALYEKDPSSMSMYKYALFDDFDGIKPFITIGLQELIETCKRWPGLTMYAPKLQLIQKDFLELVFKSNKPSSTFNVLNHGDLWTNNIMFSYNSDGKIKDVRFVDYQTLFFSSPAIDLHYFLVTGTSLESKKNMTELLKHYFQKLTHYLAKLDVKVTPPKWDDFFEDFRSRAFYGLAGAVVTLASMKAGDRCDSVITSFRNSEEKDGFRYYAFNNRRYLEDITILLAFYDELGIF